MESNRTFYDADYKRTCASVGWSLVLFLVLFNVLNVLSSSASESLEGVLVYKWHYTLTEIFNMAVYLASFLLPAYFLRWRLKRRALLTPPAYSLGKISKVSLLLIPAAIGVSLAASCVNTIVMSFFDVSEAYESLVGFEGMYEGYQIVLLYITTALVPAFCEEFLFRGTILANLEPYGKRGAIIINSLLFGLMHQNPYQIIYTVAAGAVLGMAYVKTKSIWLPTVMHFVNNAYSVTNQVVYANVDPALANSMLVVAQLLYLEAQDPDKDIQFYINSPGGDVSAGWAIMDTMNYIKSPVSTIGMGLVASMGSVLLAAGTKGKRFVLPNTQVMIHQPMAGAQGQITDMEIQLTQFQKNKKSLVQQMAAFTGRKEKEVFDAMERDNWMTPAEAKDFGLIDEVLTRK